MNTEELRKALQNNTTQTKRPPTRDELIVRQNALSHADVMFKALTNNDVKSVEENKRDYFALAAEIEAWVQREV